MLGKIITHFFFLFLFLFIFTGAVLAQCSCDSYGQNCNCPHRYILVYTIDTNGTRWVEETSDSPCTGGVNILTPADGNEHVYTRSGLPGINNVMEDPWAAVVCSSDSDDRDYRGAHDLQSYRVGSDAMPPPPRRYIFRLHPPAGYECDDVIWEKRDGDSFDRNATLLHQGTGCVIDSNFNPEDDYAYHIIVEISLDDRPQVRCPLTFQSTCNFSNNSVDFTWESVPYAAEYAIRANATPYDDWSTGPGDQMGMASTNSTNFPNILQGNTYSWFVEPKLNLNTPNDPAAACFAGLFNCTEPPTPTPTPILPCPSNTTVTCNSTGTIATFNWTLVPGANWYGLRADANPLSWADFTPAGGDGYNNVISSTQTSGIIAIQPNRPYEWSIEAKRNPADPNNYDTRCIIPGPLSCNYEGNGLEIVAGTGATSSSVKGSGLVTADTSVPEIAQFWNNPIRATAYVHAEGIHRMGLIGIALTPQQNGCTEMAVPPATISPTPPGIINMLLDNPPYSHPNSDGETVGNNKGIFIAIPLNNVNNIIGRSFEFGRFYVHYNGTWYQTSGTGQTSMPAINTTLNVPPSGTPHFAVRLTGYDVDNPTPFHARFEVTFREQMTSQLWYSRAYAMSPGGLGAYRETIGKCIPPGHVDEGTGSITDAIVLTEY